MNKLYIMISNEVEKLFFFTEGMFKVQTLAEDELLQPILENLPEGIFPMEIICKRMDTEETLESFESVKKMFHHHLFYSTLRNEPFLFSCFCESRHKIASDEYVLVDWATNGICCRFKSSNGILEEKMFEAPKSDFKNLNSFNISQLENELTMYYGRPIELKDMINFAKYEDQHAKDFLDELAVCLVNLIKQIPMKNAKPKLFFSKVNPFFNNHDFMTTIETQLMMEREV